MKNVRDIFSFQGDNTDCLADDLQDALDKLEQIVKHYNNEDSSIWEYISEKSEDSLEYTLINLISANMDSKDFHKLNELIYSLESEK